MCKQEVQQAGSDGTYDTEDDSEGKIPHESSGEAEETLMVYMVGLNLESQMGAATQDMQEMALSGYDPEKMNIVVCAGGVVVGYGADENYGNEMLS